MANEKIRLYAKKKGVPFWRIAKELGCSEPTMTRLLRENLSAEKYKSIKDVIDRLSKEKEDN